MSNGKITIGTTELPKGVSDYYRGPSSEAPLEDKLAHAKSIAEKLKLLERFQSFMLERPPVNTQAEFLIGVTCGTNSCSPSDLLKVKQKVADLTKTNSPDNQYRQLE